MFICTAISQTNLFTKFVRMINFHDLCDMLNTKPVKLSINVGYHSYYLQQQCPVTQKCTVNRYIQMTVL